MGHSHGAATPDAPRPRLARILTIVVLALAAAITVGVIALWPQSDGIKQQKGPYEGEGVSIVNASVSMVNAFECQGDVGEPSAMSGIEGPCARVVSRLDDGTRATFEIDPSTYASTEMEPGDNVRLVRLEQTENEPISYAFYEYQRTTQLIVIGIALIIVVALVGQWRGIRALVGVAIAIGVLAIFVFPAMLTGKPPIIVAIVGATAIMLIVLYLAHGVSIRTTAALFGALFGIVFTALAGVITTDWAHLTGTGSEEGWMLFSSVPDVNMSAIVSGTIVIAGLGVLNDITITQVSAVWEMRELSPHAPSRQIFTAAMRIGRDHVASSIYTLVFAYAGSAMMMLLLVYTYPQNLLDLLTTERVSQEIVRTLVGTAGLILAMPVTTLFAIALAPREQERARHAAA
ncbi:YibE/F family protein [Microbacterium sp. MPKO10]|uniref:YibE/F family protein n=1 Tax=Microbacterium sp. MPKO10 TaxID=2989818 RepID=UPI002235CD8F|nr:YibE/F family protein [Microbacterium sp. MPKO10]MCW4457790.1 YibE/F family protein [Microbacterium sp. MPKO10]